MNAPVISRELRIRILLVVISALIGGAGASAGWAYSVVDRLASVETQVEGIDARVLTETQLRQLIETGTTWGRERQEFKDKINKLDDKLDAMAAMVARIDERTARSYR